MVDEGRVARLLRGVDERIERLRAARTSPVEQRDNPLWLDGVKYLFVTAIDGCVDTAHHIAASARWTAPDTNAAAFIVLGDHDVIDADGAEAMAKAVGFRNVLVHQYTVVDDARVMAFLEALGDLRRFVTQVSAWVVAQSSSDGS